MILRHLTILLSLFIAANGKCKFKFLHGGVGKVQRSLLLNDHNNFRLMIANGTVPGQPRGINLKKLVWDKRLAREAQKIANTCVFKPVEVKDKRWPVGQNIQYRKSSEYKILSGWDVTLPMWFAEHKNYTYGGDLTPNTLHYTQMVWANTKYIGCGYSFYQTKETLKFEKFYVCNYGPGGNYEGELPYETGEEGCENLCP